MAVRSKEPQLSYEDLEKKVAFQEEKIEHQDNFINQLQHAISQLNRHRFGRRSESFVNPQQAQLPFMKEENEVKPEQAEQSISIEKHIRKKKNNKNKQLPTRTIIIPVDDKDKQCACGEQKNVIRYDVSQRINYLPAVYEILEEKREVEASPHQCENAIQAAIAPKRLLPNTAVTEEFLAHLIIAKCDDRQPLYHLEKKFKSRFGLIISRQNMARWMIACANPLMPIFNLLKDHIIDHTIASMDATTLQVLDEPNRDPSTKSYVYCFRG